MCRWLSHTSRAKNNLPSSMHRRPIDRRETIYLPRRWVIFSRLPRLPLGSVYKTENSLFFLLFWWTINTKRRNPLLFLKRKKKKKNGAESLLSLPYFVRVFTRACKHLRVVEALLGEKSIRALSKRTTLTKSARRDHRRV